MIFKISIKSLIRQLGKTVSFFLLLLFVNLFLVLSVGMRVSSGRLLSQADESFLTIAQLEYKGKNYPDDTLYDEQLNDLKEGTDIAELSELDGVRSFEPYVQLRGYVGDYGSVADKHYRHRVVILFRMADNGQCRLLKNYSPQENLVEGIYFTLDLSGFNGTPQLRTDHYYIGYGTVSDISGQKAFTPEPFYTNQLNLKEGTRLTQFYEINDYSLEYSHTYKYFLSPQYFERYISSIPIDLDTFKELFYANMFEFFPSGPFVDVTKHQDAYTKCVYDEEWVKEQPEVWKRFESGTYDSAFGWKNVLFAINESNKVLTDSVDVVMTNNPQYQPLFHQSTVEVTEGDYYTEKDGKNVCFISSVLAYEKKLKVGDTLHIDLHSAAPGDELYNSYFYGSGFIQSGDFVVKGIYRYTEDTVDTIYIPFQDDKGEGSTLLTSPTLPTYSNTYKIGTFILENATAQSFEKYASEKLNSRCQITLYDQGYLNVSAPLNSMRDTSLLLIAICIFTGVSIVLLFAYIFIVKQKGTAKTMLSLGTGNVKTCAYLMFSAIVLALSACIAGALIGYFTSDRVLSFAYEWAHGHSLTNLEYSTLRTSLADMPFVLDFGTNIKVVALTSAAVFVFSLIICFIFANAAILSKNTSGKEPFIYKVRRANMVFRQSMRSVVRTPARSMIVPLVSLAIIILISSFCGLLQRYTNEIDTLYKTVPVQGQFVTLNGSSNDMLLLKGDMLDEYVSQGYISDVDYSYSEVKYKILGVYDENGKCRDENGKKAKEYEEMPNDLFARETFSSHVFKRPKMVFATSLENTPDFYRMGAGKIDFAKDCDLTMFENDEKLCIVPENIYPDIKPGDKLRISCALDDEYGDGYIFDTLDLTVAGITHEPTNKIYAPMGVLQSLGIYSYVHRQDNSEVTAKTSSLIVDKKAVSEKAENKKITELPNYSRITAFSFTLKDGYCVDKIKKYMADEGYSYPSHIGMIRKTVVINDTELQNSVNSLIKIKGYLEALYPVMYVIIIAIAFAVSYLLIRTRTGEIAVMRSLGLGKVRTFLTMFTEQILLAIIGTALGIVIIYITSKTLTQMMLLSIGLYVLCYALGLTIAVFAVNSVNVLKIMSSKD